MASSPPDPHPDSPPQGPSEAPDQLTPVTEPGRENVEDVPDEPSGKAGPPLPLRSPPFRSTGRSAPHAS
jgi:hypothetical protein